MHTSMHSRGTSGEMCSGDVTVLLQAARDGQGLAMGRIFELPYPGLKRIAHARLRYRDDRLLLDTGALNAALPQGEDEILRVHETLAQLAKIDERLVRVVEMRDFVGLGNQEIADSLGLTRRTVERHGEKARTFLHHILSAG